MRRREALWMGCVGAASWSAPSAARAAAPRPPGPTPFAALRERARRLAAAPFQTQRQSLAPSLTSLDYDAWRAIRYLPEQAIWADDASAAWQLQLFHPGSHYQRTVDIDLVEAGVTTRLPWRTARFRYDPPTSLSLAIDAATTGAAGVRLHHRLHRPEHFDEVAVFLGGSYFRLLGREQVWGASARALAIDVAGPRGEEFPFFRSFTIEKPPPGGNVIVVNALLDSPSISGAFRFAITVSAPPDDATVVDVEAVVFARDDIARLGIAPLTSMFQRGENRRSAGEVDDFRPEVHDSDGLLLHTGAGERVWRPLQNPKHLNVHAFVDDNPRGFGLLQRDRAFDHYQDLETQAEQRPSLWIEPKGSWGKGHVELVEIPSDDEYHDNIVAYWLPQTPLRAGTSRAFGYRLSAVRGEPAGGQGRVTSTRSGNAQAIGNSAADARARLFIVEFEGGDLEALAETAPVRALLTTSRGTVGVATVQKNPKTKGWRAAFVFTPTDEVADLRLSLQRDGRPLTETWTLPCP